MTMWILNKMQLHRQRETFYVFEFDLLLFFFSFCALWGWLSCWNPQNSHIRSGLFFFPENGYCREKKSSSLKGCCHGEFNSVFTYCVGSQHIEQITNFTRWWNVHISYCPTSQPKSLVVIYRSEPNCTLRVVIPDISAQATQFSYYFQRLLLSICLSSRLPATYKSALLMLSMIKHWKK